VKQAMKSAVPLMTIFILAACGDGNDNNMVVQDNSHAEQHDTMPMVAGVKLKDDKLNAVYQHYVHLTSALVNADASEAKIASNAIETGAKEVNGGEMLRTSAAKITAAGDIEAQRSEFSNLSNAFIALVKKSGLNSGEVYVDFCPMAVHDKGAYWISADKAIRNPYFGDKMLTCGEIKETIKN
jgi:hypothetical protein